MKKILISGVLSTCFLATVTAQTVILDEDFQQGIPMATWSIVVNDTSTLDQSVIEFAPGWISVADPDNTSDTVAGASSFFTVPGEADRWLITPSLTLGAYGNFLQWNARSHDPSYQDGYYVMVSTTDTQLSSFTDTITTMGFENAEWTTRSVNLSEEGYDNQTVFIGFRLRSYDAFKLYLDSINVRVEDPVGINELNAAIAIELYPNPAKTEVTVKGKDLLSARLFSLDGQLVMEQSLITTTIISIDNLPAGTYLIEVKTANGIGRERLVKR
ncbi:MAG: choice-of-anchor J domain-containing protein [Fluviicola sp.]|nr:choice-of-anchor J domain-containing protein [Fluviicola sp.]